MNAIADMNVAGLRALAKEQGLKGYSKMRKAELVKALQPAQEQQQQPPSRGSDPGGKASLATVATIASGLAAGPFSLPTEALPSLSRVLAAGDDRKARNTAKRRRKALRARGFQAGF